MKNIFLKLIFFYTTMLVTLIAMLLVFVISTSPNIITLNYNIPFKNKLNALAPQGWAFFTKDVHKDYFNIYSVKKKEPVPVYIKSAELGQVFGVIRDNRLINHKISTILKNVDADLWYKYKGDVKNIPLQRLTKVSIKAKEPMKYGVFLIEEGTPLPYDWYKSKLKIKTTMNYIQLEIKK